MKCCIFHLFLSEFWIKLIEYSLVQLMQNLSISIRNGQNDIPTNFELKCLMLIHAYLILGKVKNRVVTANSSVFNRFRYFPPQCKWRVYNMEMNT